MAKSRLVNTRFWTDPFIQGLDNEGKLLFIYLLTNDHTNICGVYEITPQTISFESGVSLVKVKKHLELFAKNNKVFYINDLYIYLKNFTRHQQRNPKVEEGIKRELSNLPAPILKEIESIDSLCIDYDSLSYLTKLNLTKPNLNLTPEKQATNFHLENYPLIDLTEEEYNKLKEKFGDSLPERLEKLNNYIGSTGKKYKSHYFTVLAWATKDDGVSQKKIKVPMASAIKVEGDRIPLDKHKEWSEKGYIIFKDGRDQWKNKPKEAYIYY